MNAFQQRLAVACWALIAATTAMGQEIVTTEAVQLEAERVRDEIWYSTEVDFTGGDVGGIHRIDDGDLLSDLSCVVMTNHELTARLGIMPIVPLLGLDAVTKVPCSSSGISAENECRAVYFSLEQSVHSETLGRIGHGDLLSTRGQIVRTESQLLDAFRPGPTTVRGIGLDAVHPEAAHSPQAEPLFLFSVEENFFSETLGTTVGHGDLLSERGQIVRRNRDLLANFNPRELRDFGLDAVWLDERGVVWFSTEVGFDDGQWGWIDDGDLLSETGLVIRRNLELVDACNPILMTQDGFGLDALHIFGEITLEGACCLPDGSCVESDEASCDAQCGTFEGLGTSCREVDCPTLATGACCLGDGLCEDTHGACVCEELEGGTYEGDGTSCAQGCCAPACEPTLDIEAERELFIRDPSVVDDAVRTTCSGPNPTDCGPWTVTAMFAAAAGTNDRVALSEFVVDLLSNWDADQTINEDLVDLRCEMDIKILQPWINDSNGLPLDFSFAPRYFRLLGIVSRMDLQNDDPELETLKAGEGRFVFAPLPARISGDNYVLDGLGKHEHVTNDSITCIFEYRLPGVTCEDQLVWAQRWHNLNRDDLEFPSEDFNIELQAVTDLFATINADPDRPNGTALSQFRFNEIELALFLSPSWNCPAPGSGRVWELREFRLFCEDGGQGDCEGRMFTETTVEQEPDRRHNNTELLADYINSIDPNGYRVPLTLDVGGETVHFRGGHSLANGQRWAADGADPNLLRIFALNTCSGCHEVETGTRFTHVKNRQPGQASQFSAFLEGMLVQRADFLCEILQGDVCCAQPELLALPTGEALPTSNTAHRMIPRPTSTRNSPH